MNAIGGVHSSKFDGDAIGACVSGEDRSSTIMIGSVIDVHRGAGHGHRVWRRSWPVFFITGRLLGAGAKPDQGRLITGPCSSLRYSFFCGCPDGPRTPVHHPQQWPRPGRDRPNVAEHLVYARVDVR